MDSGVRQSTRRLAAALTRACAWTRPAGGVETGEDEWLGLDCGDTTPSGASLSSTRARNSSAQQAPKVCVHFDTHAIQVSARSRDAWRLRTVWSKIPPMAHAAAAVCSAFESAGSSTDSEHGTAAGQDKLIQVCQCEHSGWPCAMNLNFKLNATTGTGTPSQAVTVTGKAVTPSRTPSRAAPV